MSVGIEQWSGGMATGHRNRRLDGAEQWSWGSDVAATDGDRNVEGFRCRLGHWTLVLLGPLMGTGAHRDVAGVWCWLGPWR